MRVVVLVLALLPGIALANMLAGGFSAVPEGSNDAGVLLAKEAAAKELSSRLNAAVALEVLSAEMQVVAGTNYRLTLRATAPGHADKTYTAQVWEKLPAYGGELQVTSLEEVPSQDAAPAGGSMSPDAHDPTVQDAAAYAVQQLSQQSNSLFPFQLKQILSAKSVRAVGGEGEVHSLTLRCAQGDMTDVTFKVEVAAHPHGHELRSSQMMA